MIKLWTVWCDKIDEIKGTPWWPASLKVPTNILPDGKILGDDGEDDGYAEEEVVEVSFSNRIAPPQDEGIKVKRTKKKS